MNIETELLLHRLRTSPKETLEIPREKFEDLYAAIFEQGVRAGYSAAGWDQVVERSSGYRRDAFR